MFVSLLSSLFPSPLSFLVASRSPSRNPKGEWWMSSCNATSTLFERFERVVVRSTGDKFPCSLSQHYDDIRVFHSPTSLSLQPSHWESSLALVYRPIYLLTFFTDLIYRHTHTERGFVILLQWIIVRFPPIYTCILQWSVSTWVSFLCLFRAYWLPFFFLFDCGYSNHCTWSFGLSLAIGFSIRFLSDKKYDDYKKWRRKRAL